MNIGYYAHHHGSGHCRQADKLASLLPVDNRSHITVFTSVAADNYGFKSIPESQVVRLSAEDELSTDVLPGRAGDYWQPSCLHYSPVGNTNIQTRSHQLLNNIYQRNIDLMIIDVSVEVAMLCRAASIPYLYVRLPGSREDLPHTTAFSGALGILAPYPEALDSAAIPKWLAHKTLYLDFINFDNSLDNSLDNPLDNTDNAANSASYPDFLQSLISISTSDNSCESQNLEDRLIVTVIKGYGGHAAIDSKLPTLRRLLPDAFIISLGPIDEKMCGYVDIATHVDDVMPFIEHSDWLIMACGLNAVAQVYDYSTPLVVVPAQRPHQEQQVMAKALIADGRAMDWDQFEELALALKDRNLLAELAASNSKSNNDCDNKGQASTAQQLMQSTVKYKEVKHWFENWLLKRLGLMPNYSD